ncbi:hypothetical protein P3L10_021029 [Capsicum annuum]
MDDGINAVVLMDYVEFQFIPSHNRSHVCYGNKMETAASGLLEQLIIHSPKIISLHSKGSDVDFRFRPVRNLSDAKWFTKSTLIRMLFKLPQVLHKEISYRFALKSRCRLTCVFEVQNKFGRSTAARNA